MALSAPVRRLHHDLVQLRKARAEGDRDHRELRRDRKELKKDQRALAHDLKAGDRAHSAFDAAAKTLKKDEVARDRALRVLDAEKQQLSARLAADTFDHDPVAPGVQQDPALLQQLADATRRRDQTASVFDQKLQVDRAAKQRFGDRIQTLRGEIAQDRKELARDRKVVKHDRLEIKQDRARNKRLRRIALKHLRPAEYKLGLEATNRVRRELGLRRVNHVIRPMNLNTVRGCAQFLLKSPNVGFWSGLSTGSDRKNLERLARGEKAFVPATGGHVTPKLSMMRARVDMAKHGRVMINALTGGSHSPNSNHYRGTAVDLDLSTGNAGQLAAIARRYGGIRNFETSHIHLDF
jgi:hypothetical protein